MKRLPLPQMLSLLLLAGAPYSATAQIYAGAQFGTTDYEDAEYFATDKHSTAFGAHAGLRLHQVLAVEAAYLNLGDVRDFYLNTDINVAGVSLAGKAIFPVGTQAEFYGKMGVFFWQMDEVYRDGSYYLDEGEDLIFGAGGTFYLTPQVGLNLEYSGLDIHDMSATTVTAGFSYIF